MGELLTKIYENVVYQEKGTYEMEQRLEKEIQNLIKPYQTQFDEQTLEIIRNLMYAIELKTEHEAFQLGASFSLKLFMELSAENQQVVFDKIMQTGLEEAKNDDSRSASEIFAELKQKI